MQTLVVFCHLRWNFVYQRPQHLISRLARRYRVLFVEEPLHAEGPAFMQVEVVSGVTILTPHTPIQAPGFHDDQLSYIRPMLRAALGEAGLRDFVAWLYTPMALPVLSGLAPTAVVYDCMDELSAFQGAPRQLLQRETALLRQADLVLTGGVSLYEAKRAMHDNVLCLPSAVDAAHFSPLAAAKQPETMRRAAALHADIGTPRLGFYGVIDERLDLVLVAALADADPGWHVVMVGPVVKISPDSLPRRPNLHWIGQQDYGSLPAILAQWDVCLLPFALNDATRFISPTKTLEYMAFGRPIVSTAIHDVVTSHAATVRIGMDHAGFIEACADSLHETQEDRAIRLTRMAATVQ